MPAIYARTRTDPKVPQLPQQIGLDWQPHERIREDLLREHSPAEIDGFVAGFIAFCRKNKIERATWGATFRTWIKKGSTSTWLPKSSW